MIGIELRCSGRAANDLNCWATSPASIRLFHSHNRPKERFYQTPIRWSSKILLGSLTGVQVRGDATQVQPHHGKAHPNVGDDSKNAASLELLQTARGLRICTLQPAGQSCPPTAAHGFQNFAEGPLWVLCVLAFSDKWSLFTPAVSHVSWRKCFSSEELAVHQPIAQGTGCSHH